MINSHCFQKEKNNSKTSVTANVINPKNRDFPFENHEWLFLQICFVNDPRNPYNKLLTVEYLSNMVNGRLVLYNNQPVEVLKKLAAASLKDNEVKTTEIINLLLSGEIS